ncbi:Glutaredoxin family protein [Klebsormidium nitens]|uniref:Glutaredoxin family protein n=1 Tax=Klebsormidium nitens TaxID=105231 RepID=A0A1Y1HNJ4_KLENI|nr:Glutaredoxin family protein [Klebsormidium nitens]|eukprot:GAQ78127.1 Glutaredoxin family protein [Klebsormidium nitens]
MSGESERSFKGASAKSPSRQTPAFLQRLDTAPVIGSRTPPRVPEGGQKMRRSSLQVSKSTGNLAELEYLSPSVLVSPATLRRRLTLPVPAAALTVPEEGKMHSGRRALSINGSIDSEVTERPLFVKKVKKDALSGELSGAALGLKRIRVREDASHAREDIGARAAAETDPGRSLRLQASRGGENNATRVVEKRNLWGTTWVEKSDLWKTSWLAEREKRKTTRDGERDPRGTPPARSPESGGRSPDLVIEKIAWPVEERRSPPRLIERVASMGGRPIPKPLEIPPVEDLSSEPEAEVVKQEEHDKAPSNGGEREEKKPEGGQKDVGLQASEEELGLPGVEKEAALTGGKKEVGLQAGVDEPALSRTEREEAPAEQKQGSLLVENMTLDELAALRRISGEVIDQVSARARRRGISDVDFSAEANAFGSPISNVGPLFDPDMLASFEEDLHNLTEEEWQARKSEDRVSFSFARGLAAVVGNRGGAAETSQAGGDVEKKSSGGVSRTASMGNGGLEEVMSEVESFLSRLELDANSSSQQAPTKVLTPTGAEKQRAPDGGVVLQLLEMAEAKPPRSPNRSPIPSPKGSPRPSLSLGKPPLSPKKSPRNGFPPLPNPAARSPRGAPPRGLDRVVVYTTSVRAVRKTFEECNAVRGVFLGHGVAIDERDISMHGEFREELRALMGGLVAVPRVFIRGKYIGGAEDIQRLNDCRELLPLLDGFERRRSQDSCGSCGGVRFHLCRTCNGSCKVVSGANPDDVVRCPDCNENGLKMCGVCA